MAQPSGMKRLLRLYARVEQMRSLERRIAAQAVDEVIGASSIQGALHAQSLLDGRASLGAGEREQWAIAEAAQVVSSRHLEGLAHLRDERESVLRYAAEVHRESRLTMEQVERAMAKTDAEAVLARARREQSTADDRFASRAAWTSAEVVE